MTASCQYCHAQLPRHVSLAAHYTTCIVLAYCLGPASPFPGRSRLGEAETPAPSTGAREASRADEQRTIVRARARRKAKKQR